MARPTSPPRRRSAARAAAAASLLFHALVLAILGWRAAPILSPRSAEVEPPAIELTLVRPSPSIAASRPSARQTDDSPPPLTVLPKSAAPLPLPAPSPVPRPAPSQAPAVAAPPPPGSGTGVHPGPLPGAESGGDFKGFLRAGVGCAHRDGVGLTRLEREACDQKAGEVARAAPATDKIAPEKRAYYDAVAAAYAKMRAPAPALVLHNGDSLGVQERWAGEPGAHLPGLGCKLPLGKGPRGYKSYHNKPPHSLKLGVLPCFVTPPSGYLTEEADVEQPASARELREDAQHMKDLDPPPTTPGR